MTNLCSLFWRLSTRTRSFHIPTKRFLFLYVNVNFCVLCGKGRLCWLISRFGQRSSQLIKIFLSNFALILVCRTYHLRTLLCPSIPFRNWSRALAVQRPPPTWSWTSDASIRSFTTKARPAPVRFAIVDPCGEWCRVIKFVVLFLFLLS